MRILILEDTVCMITGRALVAGEHLRGAKVFDDTYIGERYGELCAIPSELGAIVVEDV